MAREAIYKMRVDTGSSVQDIQSFEKGLNDTTAAINKNDQAAKDMNATFEQVYGELQPLTTRLGEAEDRLYELALAGETTSDEYQKLLQTVARYRQTQIQTDMVVDQASKTFSEKLTGSVEGAAAVFQGFESVTALLGVENEALIQTMVRLQAVQGAVNAVQIVSQKIKERDPLLTGAMTLAQRAYSIAVGQSSGAMKLFRIALISTGIGAIVVGLGMLIANFDKVVGWVDKAVKKFKESSVAVKILLYPITLLIKGYDLMIWVLQKLGVVDSEETKARIKNAEDRLAAIEEERKALESRYDFEIAKARAAGQDVYDIEQAKRKAVRESILDQIKQITTLATLNGEITDEQKEQIKSLREEFVKSAQDSTVAAIAENKKRADEEKKNAQEAAKRRADELKAEQERARALIEIRNGFFAELEEAENAYYDSLLTDQQREEIAVTDKFFNLIEQAKQYGADTTTLELAQAKELSDIRKKFDEERLKKIKENEEMKIALLRSYQEVVLDEYQKELVDFEDAQAAQSKALSEALKEGVITEQQFMDAQLKLEEAYAQKELEINKKKNDAIAEANAKRWEEETKNITKALEFAEMGLAQLDAINGLLNQIGENRLATIEQQQEAELASLDEKQAAALSNESLTAEQRTKIEEDFAQQKYQVQLRAFNEEEKIKRAQFARDKALRIAQAAIDTAAAVIKSIAQGGGIPTGLPFGIAAAALGATQIATIAAQKYQGGSAPTPPSLSGGVTGAGASTFQANESANLNTEETNLSSITQNAPISQVVVLESDITQTQNKVALQEKLSTF
jgi:hypothetical protein